jgi:hypothetical protein
MDLQSFSSIFELFATFAIAYIIIDELTENPFIAQISEKILRKYQVVDDIEEEIRKDIGGIRNSLDEIAQWDIKAQDFLPNYEKNGKKLKSTEDRFEKSFISVRTIIRGNYTTKVFGYLNCFLFFFCLTMLFYGGVYSSNTWYEIDITAGSLFRARVDSSLALFTIISLLFIISGWWFDKNRKEGDNIGFFEHIYRGKFINGYVFSFTICMVGCVVGIISFFYNFSFMPRYSEFWHNFLMVACILIPILNFIIYIIKASWRANRCMPRVKEIAITFKQDYENELMEVKKFINWCGYEVTRNLELTNNSTVEDPRLGTEDESK